MKRGYVCVYNKWAMHLFGIASRSADGGLGVVWILSTPYVLVSFHG